MELTKETLQQWLTAHPAISARALSIEAGLSPTYIAQLYNARNKNMAPAAAAKLLPVLEKYGYR